MTHYIYYDKIYHSQKYVITKSGGTWDPTCAFIHGSCMQHPATLSHREKIANARKLKQTTKKDNKSQLQLDVPFSRFLSEFSSSRVYSFPPQGF